MIGVQMTVMVIALLSAGQREGDPSAAAPLSFKKKAEIAGSAPALCIMEWRIAPGLECLHVFEAQVPQLKGFPEELANVLASENARPRSAALLYLARLAAIVRQTAWLRDRDDGDDLFGAALGKHVRSIRSGLEAALQRTKENDRLHAAVALLALTADHRVALDTLTDEMRAEELNRRHGACEWVGRARLAQPRLVTALAKAIADKDAKERGTAALAALVIGPKASKAAPAVIAWLKRGDAAEDGGIQFLTALLLPGRGVAVTLSLAGMGADAAAAVPVLVERLKRSGAEDRCAWFTCLAQFGPRAGTAVGALRPYLTSADEGERFAAAAALLCIDPDEPTAAKVLVEGVKTHSRAIGACADTTPKVKALVPLLIDTLKDPQSGEDAAEALGNMGTLAEPAIPHLAAMATEKRVNASRQFVAASAVARIGKASIPALAKILARPGLAEGRGSAAFVLGSFRDEAKVVVPLLIRAVEDKNPDVRFNAAAALGRLRKAAAPARAALTRASRRQTGLNDVVPMIDADLRETLAGMNDLFAMQDAAGQSLALWALTQLDRD